VQVATEHYSASNYDELHRWMSYWYQIQTVVRSHADTVLEIGLGTGVLSDYLRRRLALNVTTCDFDPSLHPDLICDVRKLDTTVPENGFDAVLAFQILEHLPFDDFVPALQQLARASRRCVIFSLPHYGWDLQFRFRLWKRTFAFSRKISKHPRWSFDGEHHWEIGTRGHSLVRLRDIVAGVLNIERAYFCADYPYHYFFECTKKHTHEC
jgi:2-polyprenyl-3-methyl-5-hydroxy-6-metoxy-1,4-benzoquinol methylase